MAASSSSDPDPVLQQTYRDFISACHILHYHRVLDAYGHLSVRHPHHQDQFIMSRSIAPATISSPRDLVVYSIATAQPLDPSAPAGYAERHIHSEILRRDPSAMAVVHSHSDAVVPYTISGVPFGACCHMAGFLGTGTPVFDIGEHYVEGDRKDLLVRDQRLGERLAECFDGGRAAVLMRGHGFTVQGNGIREVVLRAVYTQVNAGILTTALTTRGAWFGAGGGSGDGVKFLSEQEAEGAMGMTRWSAGRPWGLWLREVEAQGLYVNTA